MKKNYKGLRGKWVKINSVYLLGRKLNSMHVTSAALYRYGLHYSVLLEMMMSVLREVKGLAKNIYFIILPVGRPVSMQNFRLNVYTVYLF